jgi:hypothetical protein
LRGTASNQLNRIQFLLIAGALRHGSFQELTGLGHHFLVEDPDATCALLEQFFERIAQNEAASA